MGEVRAARCFLACVALAGGVRAWQLVGTTPAWWNDSQDFLDASHAGLFSLERWAGPRTAAAPLVLWLAGGDVSIYVMLQAVIATLCWAALATSVWTVVRGRRARWGAAFAVVAFSCTVPVTMWERSVLSEGLATATLALVVAALVQTARGLTPHRAAALLAAVAAWLATRDTHAVVVLVGAAALGALALAGWWWRGGRGGRRSGDGHGHAAGSASAEAGGLRRVQRLAALACGLAGLGLLATAAAAHGERYAYPLRNVFQVRVLPYPDRVAWFEDHGMPQAELLAGPDAPAPSALPGQAPVVFLADGDPTLRPWLDWVATDGRATFAAWVATHPGYVLTELTRDPERSFNNAGGDRSFYSPGDLRVVPWVTDPFVPSRPLALTVAVGAAAWAVRRRRWRSPLVVAGAVTVALAAPHALVSWHSDGMETARHLLIPVLQLHLAALLMVFGATTAASAGPSEGSEPGTAAVPATVDGHE
jgi:hypothetical protein